MRGRTIDNDSINELERLLLSSDVGPTTTDIIVSELRDAISKGEKQNRDILELLHDQLVQRLSGKDRTLFIAGVHPTVILVAGVNGVGKTTSVAKIGRALREENRSVLLAAADTFRAGAVSQLAAWADRLGIEIVKGQQGADPAAVCAPGGDRGGGAARGAGDRARAARAVLRAVPRAAMAGELPRAAHRGPPRRPRGERRRQARAPGRRSRGHRGHQLRRGAGPRDPGPRCHRAGARRRGRQRVRRGQAPRAPPDPAAALDEEPGPVRGVIRRRS